MMSFCFEARAINFQGNKKHLLFDKILVLNLKNIHMWVFSFEVSLNGFSLSASYWRTVLYTSRKFLIFKIYAT